MATNRIRRILITAEVIIALLLFLLLASHPLKYTYIRIYIYRRRVEPEQFYYNLLFLYTTALHFF